MTDIKTGDTVIISWYIGAGEYWTNEVCKNVLVKVLEYEGTEYKSIVIIDREKNKYFNLRMFLDGESWVSDLYVIIS